LEYNVKNNWILVKYFSQRLWKNAKLLYNIHIAE